MRGALKDCEKSGLVQGHRFSRAEFDEYPAALKGRGSGYPLGRVPQVRQIEDGFSH